MSKIKNQTLKHRTAVILSHANWLLKTYELDHTTSNLIEDMIKHIDVLQNKIDVQSEELKHIKELR